MNGLREPVLNAQAHCGFTREGAHLTMRIGVLIYCVRNAIHVEITD